MRFLILALFLCLVKNIYGQSDVNLEILTKSLQDALNRSTNNLEMHPDTGLNIVQFLEKYEYPLEIHEVQTEDGWFLTLHRIPFGHRSNKTLSEKPKPAVLLVHGLACSAMDWIYLGPNSSLALLLADIGYDVWLVSTRGTQPSSKHLTLNSSDPAYWDFSFHEKGYYDLAASLDYITRYTGLQKVTLIGHSEGTTESLILTSSRPEYNDKINLMVLLSPIAYMDGVVSPLIKVLVKHLELIEIIFKLLNIHGMSYSPTITQLGIHFCNDQSRFQQFCADFIELLCGFDYPQFNKNFLTVFMSNTPSGMSFKELIHYGQEIRSGYFRQYDYGIGNILHYGTTQPPSYNISKITAPVAIYYGKNDFFASIPDVKKVHSELQNPVELHLVEYELFNHVDFILAIDVKTLLYDTVISTIQEYNPLNV